MGCGRRGVAEAVGSPRGDRLSSGLSRVIEGSIGVARQTRSNNLTSGGAKKHSIFPAVSSLSSHVFFIALSSYSSLLSSSFCFSFD